MFTGMTTGLERGVKTAFGSSISSQEAVPLSMAVTLSISIELMHFLLPASPAKTKTKSPRVQAEAFRLATYKLGVPGTQRSTVMLYQ